jgi:hypothetical protein
VLEQCTRGARTARDGARGPARRQDAVPCGKRTPPTVRAPGARGGAAASAVQLTSCASMPANLKPAAVAAAAAVAAEVAGAVSSPLVVSPRKRLLQAQLPPSAALLRVASGPVSPVSWSGSFAGSFSGRGARHGPPAANAALYAGAASGSFSLPHSSAFAPRPLPAPAAAPPQMSQPSALLTAADAQVLAGARSHARTLRGNFFKLGETGVHAPARTHTLPTCPRCHDPRPATNPAAAPAATLPPLHRLAPWRLVYSSFRDGTSLHTLLRKAAGAAPTLLVVQSSGGGLFGAYCTEAWHTAPRFYGTGETFVFSVRGGRGCRSCRPPLPPRRRTAPRTPPADDAPAPAIACRT